MSQRRANPWEAAPAAKTTPRSSSPSSRPAVAAGKTRSSASGAMQECLALADRLGCGLSNTGSTPAHADPAASLVLDLAKAQREHSQQRVRKRQTELDTKFGGCLLNSQRQAKADRLAHAAFTLERLVRQKDLVLRRLRQPASGATLPVEASGQADLKALLGAIAQEHSLLQTYESDVGWLAQFLEPCSVWARNLEHILEAQETVITHHEMLAASQELTQGLDSGR